MALNDSIHLAGIRAYGTHGVLNHEHYEPQEFVVDVDLLVDTDRAAETDDIADTINYAELADTIVAQIEGEHCDLIETLAHRILNAIMSSRIVSAEVVVHKPNAPIGHQFSDVSVSIVREGPLFSEQLRTYVIAIGSNLDNPEEHVRQAIAELSDFGERVEDVSSLYRSAPQLDPGQDPQPDYINAVVSITSPTPPMAMLNFLNMVEEAHGRERNERWGARTLDLDIIDVSGVVSDYPVLVLPHPRAHERRFVLEPWLEIDPHAQLNGVRVSDLLPHVLDQRVSKVGFGDGS
ncbi:dihydroneopterin aldolase / 2-amino-4-hydroxy-6-hydroxymethyldihydropteridine diphosphokinase [Arcanobacterium phocae]|uniref:Bifunctional folate synthesis protein n=1 Tax=Arcanobacterium phocae TaxID=131112 RepID=A0A1H2L9Y9_9ACTO|nr:2-amino-4-hydroxy-6-hydroxymethyldihydropteridine diphosphokinase [Arcanobacterium phocae]SDU77823.1 dihydroneopterin aldolase / 2-amino-4-hydroxy-6-hydroxymethyldihydropteridine diphosphokinase [Arcanobacterium phocae]